MFIMASWFRAESFRKKSHHNFYGPGSSDLSRHESVGTPEPINNGFQSLYKPFLTPYNFAPNFTSSVPDTKLPVLHQEQVSTASNYEFFSDEFDNEKTSCGQVAFLNQLLEDTEDGNVSKTDASYNKLSEKFCLEDESIGQLAIKLADIALSEVNVPVKQSVEVPKANRNFEGQNAHYQSFPKIQNFSITKPYNARTNYVKKTQGFPNSKKKRFPNNKIVTPKGFRQVSVIDARQEYPSIPYHKLKSSNLPRNFSDAPFWSDSIKSDGSSQSSNSSVHKESYFSSDLMKYKMFPKPSDSEDDNTMSPAPLRRGRKSHSISSSSSGGRAKYNECVLCKTNGETPAMYRSHVLKDERGRTVCQVLQRYICPLCGATGINAHTVKYCPKNENPPQVATMTTLKSMRSSTGRKRYGPCSGHIRSVPFGIRQNPLSA